MISLTQAAYHSSEYRYLLLYVFVISDSILCILLNKLLSNNLYCCMVFVIKLAHLR